MTTYLETTVEHDAGAGIPVEDGPRAITALDPGYTYFTDYLGHKWLCCTCVKEFLTYAQMVGKKRGWIKQGLDVWQLTGNADASAGTHSKGGAFDLLYQTDPSTWIKFFRDHGANATWKRYVSQGFTKDHTHGVLRGCPHVADAALAQTKEQQYGPPTGGGDGLVGTRADYHPDPVAYVTWSQGVTAMKKELGLLAQATTSTASVFPVRSVKHTPVRLTAKVSPAAAGTFKLQFSGDGGSTWRDSTAAPKAADKGEARFENLTPGYNVDYRVVFTPKDATAYKESTSGGTHLEVYDLLRIDNLEKQVSDLTARVSALESSNP